MSNIQKKYTIEFLKEKKLILLEALSGSHAYGTNIPTSDIDIRGVFIMERDDYFGLEYIDQVNDETNDTTYYEIGRFVELLLTNNPNILELLNIPEDCLKYKNPIMDLIEQKDFISKLCSNSFSGYATQQIRKARGLNKKIVNPIAKEKKTPIDFCYIIEGYGSVPLKKWLEEQNFEQKFCGLVNIDHARDIHAIFHDMVAQNCFSETTSEEDREKIKKQLISEGKPFGFGYKGIEVDNSNTIRISSIPKDQEPIGIVSYNKDGYTSYCNDYRDYWDWDKKKNPERFKISSENKYDCKNMMHCFRLTEMAKEIALGKGVIVRRPNRDFLMKIRNGEMKYNELLDMAEKNLKEADSLFKKSSLQESPSFETANQILIDIRKKVYSI